MATAIAEVIAKGWRVVIVHGNGPQVGALALQQAFQHERVAGFVPPEPLFSLGAMTQGQVGSILVMALQRHLGGESPIACVVTHTVVAADDPAFACPTKPIGPFFSAEEASALARDRGWVMVDDAGRGLRRVVPSPVPQRFLEAAAIRQLVSHGTLVVAGGGGGVPVIASSNGFVGVEAVIDKDLAASSLARSLGADALALVTAVPNVELDFGTPRQRSLYHLDVGDAERYLSDGQFPPGSMGPKIEASITFLRQGGQVAVITSPERLLATLDDDHAPDTNMGTRIEVDLASALTGEEVRWSR